MGLSSAYQIYSLSNKLKDVEQTQNLLVHLTDEQSTAIKSVSSWLIYCFNTLHLHKPTNNLHTL